MQKLFHIFAQNKEAKYFIMLSWCILLSINFIRGYKTNNFIPHLITQQAIKEDLKNTNRAKKWLSFMQSMFKCIASFWNENDLSFLYHFTLWYPSTLFCRTLLNAFWVLLCFLLFYIGSEDMKASYSKKDYKIQYKMINQISVMWDMI